MNKLKNLIPYLSAVAVCYLAVAFYNLSTDPHVWGEGGRYIFLTTSFFSVFIMYGFKNDLP